MSSLNGKEKNIPVIVADDHELIVDKVVQLIDPDFEVVATAADGKAALEKIRLLEPEIAILDISMPLMTGIEVCAELKKSGSTVKVVVLTAHDDQDYLRAAFNAGAMGFVLKFRMAADLMSALEAVKVGAKFASPLSTI